MVKGKAKASKKNVPVKEKEEASLWVDLKKGSQRARDEMVRRYLHLVKYVIKRLLPSSRMASDIVDYDDLYCCGVLGLMNAVDGYKLERQVKFVTYAIPRIRGAIIDELRAVDWFPRSLRQDVNRLQHAYMELEHQLLRPATDEEICGYMDITPQRLSELLQAANRSCVLSLDEEMRLSEESFVTRGDMTFGENVSDPRASIHRQQVVKILGDCIHTLPDKEQKVILMYYNDEMTFKEIGTALKVTESRVCQLHAKAILRLRGRLAQQQRDLVT